MSIGYVTTQTCLFMLSHNDNIKFCCPISLSILLHKLIICVNDNYYDISFLVYIAYLLYVKGTVF